MKNRTNTGLVMIGIGLYKPWLDILEFGQEPTWLSDSRPDSLQILHVHAKKLSSIWQKFDKFHEKWRFKSRYSALLLRCAGEILLFPFRSKVPGWKVSTELSLRDPAIEIQIPDGYLSMKWKDLGLLKYYYEETNHDFLVITTTSSYLNLRNLDLLLQQLPTSNTYYGPSPHTDAKFVSGSFRVISRDVALAILENSKYMRATLLEDVALGRLLNRLGISPSFFQITSFDSVSDLKAAQFEDLKHLVHFRLKTGTNEHRGDTELMRILHEKLNTSGVETWAERE